MKFFCEYCGYHIDAEKDAKCPSCDASYNRNKTYLRLEKESKEELEKINKERDKIKKSIYRGFSATRIIFTVFFILIALFFAFVIFNIFNADDDNNLTQNEKDNIQAEIDSINTQLASLKAQLHKEFNENGFSEKYYLIENEIDKLEDSVRDKELKIR